MKTQYSAFTDFEHCFHLTQIDTKNDELKLESTSSDGVCITSLTVDGKQLLVGKNGDMKTFWIDGDQKGCFAEFTSTPQVTIKNGLGKFQN